MSGPLDSVVQSESAGRMLSFGAVRVHNLHLQGGRSYRKDCRICGEGLDGALEEAAWQPTEGPEVAESDGADEEGDAASSLGDGPSGWEH